MHDAIDKTKTNITEKNQKRFIHAAQEKNSAQQAR